MSPGGAERDGVRFHYPPQKCMQLKTYELFVPEIFRLIVSDNG